jgi:hypothetical protein
MWLIFLVLFHFVWLILLVEYTEMASLPSNFERQSFPPRYISEGQWGENRLKAERAWFLTEEVRRAKPETEPLLTRWGKSGVFSESTVLSFSNILGGRFHRLPSVDSSRRLNLQGRFFHSRVFYPHYLEENQQDKGIRT